MPIYPYVCSACNHEFETLQKVSDEPLRYCPQCGEQSLRKRLTAPAFQLKGTGWYETDFKDKGKKKDGKDKTEEGKTDGKKAEGKDDAKSAPAAGDKGGGAKSEPVKSDSK